MKRLIFKLISLVVVLAIVSSIIPGCSSIDRKDREEQMKTGGVDVAPPAEATLTMCIPGLQENQLMREMLDEVENRVRDTLNVKISLNWKNAMMGDKYMEEIEKMVAAGEPLEAFYYGDGSLEQYIEMNMNVLKQKKLFMHISELFPQNAPELYGRYTEEELDCARVDGKLAAVPCRFPMVSSCYAVVRKDFMKKYNISGVKSMADFEKYLQAVKQNERDCIPLAIKFNWIVHLLAQEYGYAILDENLGLVYRWNDPAMKIYAFEQTPEFKKVCDRLKNWKIKGYIKADSKEEKDAAEAIHVKNNVASLIAADPLEKMRGIIGSHGRSAVFWGFEGEYEYYPLFPEGVSQKLSPTAAALMIPSSAKYPERTLRLLEWIQSDPKNYDLWMYGIEGKHYTLYGEQFNYKDQYALNASMVLTWFGGQQAFWNMDDYRTHLSVPPENKEKYRELVGMNAKYPPHLGFCPDLGALRMERELRLIEPDVMSTFDFEGYIQKQKEYGIDKIVAEVQRQLNKWRAGKAK